MYLPLTPVYISKQVILKKISVNRYRQILGPRGPIIGTPSFLLDQRLNKLSTKH